MPKPIYFFTGFLDAGKTTVIKETLLDPNFDDGSATLLISFETGSEKYDDSFLKDANAKLVTLKVAEFDKQKMLELEREYDFERIVIEFNGMEDDTKFLETYFIDNWELAEVLMVANTKLFNLYNMNLKQKMYNHVKYADVAIYNRYTDEDMSYIRNNLKAINPYIQLVFENINREIVEFKKENIFDLSKKDIVISDQDYGLWYLDVSEEPEKWENKNITIRAKWTSDLSHPSACVVGRQAMVCCADDLNTIGLTVLNVDKENLDHDKYYEFKGLTKIVTATNGMRTIVLYVDTTKECEKPNPEFVNFS